MSSLALCQKGHCLNEEAPLITEKLLGMIKKRCVKIKN
jgi:hypothetical protein